MRPSARRATVRGVLGLSVCLPALDACSRSREDSKSAAVTVYCSVDEVFARRVLEACKVRTGIEATAVFDSEAGKTTGLVNRIIEEARSGRPRADVFWSSEIFGTILLARQGLLQPYDPPGAADIPRRFRDREHRWTAVAARARVLAFDPARTKANEVPTSWESLADERYARRLALANPLFGTTRGHVAAMFTQWGEPRTRGFLTKLHEAGVLVVDGNSAAVRAVMAGQADFAATDADDVFLAQKGGASLDLVYPDMGGGGTLMIPCSVAIVRGAPHSEAARALVDFLISAEAERLLAESDSRNVPVREKVRSDAGMLWPPESKVDYDAVADAMDAAVAAVREILIR